MEGSGRGAFEDYQDYWDNGPSCEICFQISFDHPGCEQCRSCPGGPLDAAGLRKTEEKLKKQKKKKRKRKNKLGKKDKRKRTGSKRERRQTDLSDKELSLIHI